MEKRRDRLEIIHDILKTIQDRKKVKPTHILYKSNLSHQMLTEYLTELISKGFIMEERDKKGRKTYSLAEKGFKYLADYSRITAFLESYGLE
jgi:predicted transcriptional regulator